ncbi:cell wall-binding repeat-containing protein [Desulfosporosinus shakirovi]|uniref:cell wall-binding repeat-containing protein n=1 Tax=Desulfosporosinus shakirovi TaxID=2885154 RepID=UPI001E2A6C48|nr:cell wall-binding repeat-containing protein [Desulfosporosinus sp. SRJS8]MCB8814268.1 cell wall-binding repeat-containing protein [Desulfosporosinus sp. SRJS8]
MRSKMKMTWLVGLLTLMLAVTGCSQNQQVLFDASMKMQDVTSLQQQTTITLQLSGSGFDPEVQQQVDMAKAFMNNAKLSLNAKTSTNKEKTVVKSQVDMDLDLQGMSFNMPVWVDSDLTGDTPKIIEVIKIPQVASASFPPQFAGKEYMVMNPSDMGASEPMNFSQLTELISKMQSKQVDFLTSYAKRFNPDVNVVSKGSQYVETNDGRKSAKLYEVKLNDAQLKKLIRYTVNNFTQDEEAMMFVKEFMHSILELSQLPEDANTLGEFDKAFEEFDADKQEFLTEFNKVMDQFDDVTFLGDEGVKLEYAIVNGYVVKQSGIIDLEVNLNEINQLMNNLTSQESTSEEVKGNLNLKVSFSTVTSGINRPVEIEIPVLNENNSFDYMDLMESMVPEGTAEGSMRLAGQDSYKTARTIAEEYESGQCDNIILVSGLNYTDALSSNILSKKFNAPILLAGATVEESSEAFDYIAKHSKPDTKILIIGGTVAIGTAFETELIKGGHANIERISGFDLYETGMAVVDKANVGPGTPVVIVSGESFPDALGSASLVGSKQYPTLLVSQNSLADRTKAYISGNQPSAVYIIGGAAVISQSVEAQIKELAPNAAIKRLAGNDRFDTAGVVLNEFSTNPKIVYLANGFDFRDAIAGSALAAKTGDPVLLIDPALSTLPPATEAYLTKLRDAGARPMVRALGGSVVVPDSLIIQAESLLYGE